MFTQVIADLSEDSQEVQLYFKKEIMDIFQNDNFFQQSECTLCKWQIIIRRFTMTNNEVLEGLLNQFGKIGGLFTSGASEAK